MERANTSAERTVYHRFETDGGVACVPRVSSALLQRWQNLALGGKSAIADPLAGRDPSPGAFGRGAHARAACLILVRPRKCHELGNDCAENHAR